MAECFKGGNTAFLCYCEGTTARVKIQDSRVETELLDEWSYQPLIVDVVERNQLVNAGSSQMGQRGQRLKTNQLNYKPIIVNVLERN